jgi:4-aminobutyrate aminotransferase-like enzyme
MIDEIPGFGERENFGFQNYDVVPDIVVMGKEWVEECLWAPHQPK